MTGWAMASDLRPTPRQRQCFEAYCRLGDHGLAAAELRLSIQRQKANVSAFYRRIGANSGVQAAYMTWGPSGD